MGNLISEVQNMIRKQKLRQTPFVDMDGFKVYYERIKE